MKSGESPESIKLCLEQLNKQMDKLGIVNNSLKIALVDDKEDPWSLSRPQLQENAIKRWQEGLRDEMEGVRDAAITNT